MFTTNFCENPYILRIILFVYDIIKIVYYLIPIILIIFLLKDLLANVVSSDDGVTKKNLQIAIRRVIMAVTLFLVPTIVSVLLGVIEDTDTLASDVVGSYTSCLDNIENIEHFEKKFNAKVKVEEQEQQERLERQLQQFQKSIKNKEEYNQELRKKAAVVKKPTGGNSTPEISNAVGKAYNLTESQINGLAHICVREQGNTVNGAGAEASLMANLTDKSSKYSSVYDYVVYSEWFGKPSSEVIREMSNPEYTPSADVLAKVKDILLNGNRSLPLYIDEHDCWDCDDDPRYQCPNFKGDICKLENDGNIITSLSGIKNRDNYVKDKTIIRTVFGNSTEYYTFYIFPTSKSDPFGYTPGYYKTIKENG